MIPDEESLEFLLEHLKLMIQEQPDKKIEKISDLTEILSDFMSTFLVVVDTLISSSQRRFGAIDQKLNEFEDLLLGASIKGLSELSKLSQVTEKRPIKETEQLVQEALKTTKSPPKPSSDVVSSPSPHPQPSTTLTKEQIPAAESTGISLPESTEIPNEKPIEISEDMEVEDLAAYAFQQREKVRTPPPRPASSRLGGVSLKMELMQELKKKFGSKKVTQNESK